MTRRIPSRNDTFGNRRAPVWRGVAHPDRNSADVVSGDALASENAHPAGHSGDAVAWLHQIVGFTLVELLIVIAVIGALAAIALPNYRMYIKRAETLKTVADLKLLETEIQLYYTDNEAYPDSLADIGRGEMTDMWGSPYKYTNISLDLAEIEEQQGNSGVGKFRSYLNTKPINTDFDIYSMGPDGKSARPLTSKNSYDDIIRGNNGGYFGVALNF